MNLIATGNVEGMKKLLREHKEEIKEEKEDPYIVKRLLSDPLRDRKNGFIIRNTVFRIAARKGGLPPLFVHHLSEKYALKIEQAPSIDYLNNLSEEMLLDYANSVQTFSTSNYSKLIQEVVSYITVHLTEKLTLQIIAEKFHVHPSHLARKFKNETGMTIIQYINYHRVNYAILLFQEGYDNVLEVAQLSGFNSSSYFTRVFKKITGKKPTDYIIKK